MQYIISVAFVLRKARAMHGRFPQFSVLENVTEYLKTAP
jgi:hypothetical protein